MSKIGDGVQISLSWVYTSNSVPPPRAIEAGPGVYVARRSHGQDLIPGKLVPMNGKIYVSCDNKEWEYMDGEVLCDTSLPNTTRSYAWQHAKEGRIPKRAVAGGITGRGDILYVARCQINGECVVGKVHEGHDYGHFPHGGEEKHVTEYDVLIYKKD